MKHSSERRLRRYQFILHQLCKSKSPKHRQVLLREGGPGLIKCLCECIYNVIKGNVPLGSGQKKKLRRYKKHLRELADRKTSSQKKTKILNQKRGFLPAVLAPILSSLAGSVLTGILK